MTQKLLIAGGGTGGHVFSGLAVAEEWTARGGEVVFVGSPDGMEFGLVKQRGYDFRSVPARRFKGASFKDRVMTILSLPEMIGAAKKILQAEQPDRVLGIGGFVSGPTVLTAFFMGFSTAIVDQNAIPGMTNRILGLFVKKIFLAFAHAATFFRRSKTTVTGNPVIRERIPEQLDKDFSQPILAICGGSQGAAGVNKAFLEAIPFLMKTLPDLKIIHQTGVHDFVTVKNFYDELGLSAEVQPFFEHMEPVYEIASLMIARSGAGTMTEAALWGMPSDPPPLPTANTTNNRSKIVPSMG